jgi:integrase
MAIFAECPFCHRKQGNKNRICVGCGIDLVKPKRAGKVKYHIHYRLPGGEQRWEMVKLPDGRPGGIEEARAAEGKRKAQKVENPSILERVPAERMTFSELADWYLEQESVKELSSLNRIKGILSNFNEVHGDRIVSSIKLEDLEKYQAKRKKDGRAPATIDMEISIVKTMVTKAFDNDLVDGRTVKAFRPVKKKLKKGANARKRKLTIEEYLKLLDVAADHLKPVLIIGLNTGMRLGEIRALRWSHIDREQWVIRLPKDIPKEKKPKVIPINHHVKRVLADLPRAIHHDFVLTYQNEPIRSAGGVKNSFSAACKKAGIIQGRDKPDGIIFHDIRRTVKTNMLNAGMDKAYRDKIMGHSLTGMDVHYLAPSEEDLHRAMAIYTSWLDNQIANASQNASQEPKKG